MPTPALPLTPAASTEIAAKERPWTSSSSESSLSLPPPALQSAVEHGPLSPNSAKSECAADSTNERSLHRTSTSTSKKLRPVPEAEPFTLPSPPTRSRKIIQMKPPRPQPEAQSPSKRRKTASTTSLDPPLTQKTSVSSSTSNTANTSKPTKKAIRKTAHSLIERRRRSKMNDAFSTLKEMIPACRGGDERDGMGKEMHKLDVLNAGIEYLRYLEKCLEKMNERQWEGKPAMEKSPAKEEVDDEVDGDIEAPREDNGATSTGTTQKSQVEQQYFHEQENVAKGEYIPIAPLATCHCHCPCHSREGNNAHVSVSPRPPPPSVSASPLEPRPQDYFLASQPSQRKDISRDQDRDHEETTNTAAALLMLTSTDRRSKANTTANSPTEPRPMSSHRPSSTTSGIHHHSNQTSSIWKPYAQIQPLTRTPTIKGGLSVRDLLLK